MAEGGQLITREEVPHVGLAEGLTAQFYAWERRGRAWQVWPDRVSLEPPFRTFHFYHVPATRGAAYDDGRKPTFLSSLVDRLRRRGQTSPVVGLGDVLTFLEGPEPDRQPYGLEDPLVEVQLSLPPTFQVGQRESQQFLLSLAGSSFPFSFEVVGERDSVHVQVACREPDRARLVQQLGAHFPDAALLEERGLLDRVFVFGVRRERLFIEFGLSHECMLPIRAVADFRADPLVSVVGALDGLEEGEAAALQVLFQSARHPWAENMLRAVTDWEGRPFFRDAPETLSLAREKVRTPLFGALVRVAIASPEPARLWELARTVSASLGQFTRPGSNGLMPLSLEGLEMADLEDAFLERATHRSGMLLNAEELASLVHPPSASVRSAKLVRERKKTKAAPHVSQGHALVLGENVHAGHTSTVTLSPEVRSKHLHVIGATGTGKSHLLLSLITQDLEEGRGVGVLDPHGDLVDQVLGHVPEDRTSDVVLVDPSDAAFPVGFNILQAHSELEKNLLASDMVAGFQRLSTSWGDQMTAVLANAVIAFLESPEGGTLADLRRFLVDAEYRKRFVRTVRDPEIVFFWEREFPLLSGKPQAPILTRLNAFLRHPLVRYMVVQKENRLDFAGIMDEGGIFLAKLAQGAIGEENAQLLGTLLVSRFHQIALGRQSMAQAERRPFTLYIDEFHNFATPSLSAILEGARKYGLSLVLAHQDLEQLRRREPALLSAVLTNPATRICFRVGDRDARSLSEGFSTFGAQDLQRLGVGEAICRIERADWDFNLRTFPHPTPDAETARHRQERLTAISRERYGTPREEVESLLRRTAPRIEPSQEPARSPPEPRGSPPAPSGVRGGPEGVRPTLDAAQRPEASQTAPVRPPPPSPPRPGKGGTQHTYLQELVKRWAEARGYRATVEKEVLDGLGSVDVALEKGEISVACEITVTTTPEHELSNVRKCLAAGFRDVAVVSSERKTLRRAQERIAGDLEEDHRPRVHYFTPEELFAFLEERDAEAAATEETVRGWKVKRRYKAVDEGEKEAKRQAISKVILKAVKRLKKSDD